VQDALHSLVDWAFTDSMHCYLSLFVIGAGLAFLAKPEADKPVLVTVKPPRIARFWRFIVYTAHAGTPKNTIFVV